MRKIYDAVIIGGGPAGLSAAIYLARAQFHVLVVERENDRRPDYNYGRCSKLSWNR